MNGTAWMTRARLLEIARFCAVGGGTFAVDEGFLILLHHTTRMPLGLDTAIAYTIAALLNFVLSRQWVFEQASEGAEPRTAMVRYVIVVVIGLLVTSALVPAGQAVGIDYPIGKALASGLVGIANYFAFPMWVFKGKGDGRDEQDESRGESQGESATVDAPETSEVG